MYSNSALTAGLIQSAKAANPYLTIIAGGPHFGAQPEEALRAVEQLDFVVAGEGEIALTTLIDALNTGSAIDKTPNIAWRAGKGEIRQNRRAQLLDLHSLPNIWEASAEVLDLGAYARTISETSPHRSIYIEAGRGCPYRCNFCAPAQFWDRRYRVKAPSQIASEIYYLYTEYMYDAFILVHDLLTADGRYVNALAESIRSLGLPVRWMANSRIDLEKARDFKQLAESGCWRLFYGVDSGSSRVQRLIEKNLEPERAIEVIGRATTNGLGTVCSFVVGHLEETEEELSESLLLGARLKLVGAENVQFHRLRLFPPAPIASGASLRELLTDSSLDVTTLLLEYPLSDIAPEERAFIEKNPRFYAGYFPPPSTAGTAEEISQIELFFTQGIAFAPLTLFVLGRLAKKNLVRQFCEHLSAHGMMNRSLFDPSEMNIVRNWCGLKERLEMLIDDANLEPEERAIISGVLRYEDSRMRFVHEQSQCADSILWQKDHAIARSTVAVDLVLEAAVAGEAPYAGMLQDVVVIFERGADKVVKVVIGR